MRKTSFSVIAFLSFCLAGNNVLSQDKPCSAPLNPDFIKYLESMKSGTPRQMISSEGHGLGYIPPPVDMSHVKGFKLPKAGKTYGTSFDLRDSNKCPSVKGQGAYGTCWAFATCASLESNLMPLTPEPNFSENNLANKAGFDLGFSNGGNGFMSTAYLARWAGPYNDSDDPYPHPGYTPPSSAEVQKHVQNVLMLPARTSYTDNDNIKWALTTYGALYCAFEYADANYNATNYAYYDGTDTNANHAVTLIGWDDNFLASKFNSTPAGNGAFLLKNSWGTSWGDQGYFWLSYYDKSFQRCTLFYGEESTSNYDDIYQYDPLGWVSDLGTGSTDNLWCANIFTATSTSSLKAVSFYTTSDTCSYDIRIHTGVTADQPVSGTLAATKTGSFDIPGYHTVQLSSPISITNASLFSVAIEMTTPGYDYPCACEYAIPGYSSDATASPGQSFYSTDGTSWTDLTDEDATANFCIKAFTAIVETVLEVNPTTLNVTTDVSQSPDAQTFQVWNGGTGTLDFTISDDAAWLACTPSSGTSTGSSDKKTITVNYSTATLAGGEYTGTITVTNVATSVTETVTVNLIVGPEIGVTPELFDIKAAFGTDADSVSFSVWNEGGGTLTYTITDNAAWLACSPTSGTSTGEHDVIIVNFDTSGLAVGTYSATITVTDADASNSPLEIPVTLTVAIKPVIDLDTAALAPVCALGNNADSDSFKVSNGGNNCILNYYISVNADWLTCAPVSGSSTDAQDIDTITVTYATTTLAIGTYNAVITVSDANALNSPQTINVTLEVGPGEDEIPQYDLKVLLVSNTGGITRDTQSRVSFWPDFSINSNNAMQNSKLKQPLISNVFFGQPTLLFSKKNYLEMPSATDVSLGGPFTTKTIVIYFKTGSDILSRQMIFKQGDKVRGLNMYLDSGSIYMNAWDLFDDNGTGSAWGPIFISKPIVAETVYTAIFVFDEPNRQIEGYLNGTSIGTAVGIQELYSSTGHTSIGGVAGTTYLHDGKKTAPGFKGRIAAFFHYNKILTALEMTNLENYIATTYLNSLTPVDEFVLWIDSSNGIDKNSDNYVAGWTDRSPSSIKFRQSSKLKKPLWTENVVNSIPGLFFDGANDFMAAGSNAAINASSTAYTAKTIFMIFKTGSSVSGKQTIWAQGDKNAGLNIYIDSGALYMSAWNLKAKNNVTAWGPVNVSGAVAANTLYCAELVFDQAGDNFEGFLDGVTLGNATGIGSILKHAPGTIGAVKGSSQFKDGAVSGGSYFTGSVFESIMYNRVLTASQTDSVENYINGKYGINFD